MSPGRGEIWKHCIVHFAIFAKIAKPLLGRDWSFHSACLNLAKSKPAREGDALGQRVYFSKKKSRFLWWTMSPRSGDTSAPAPPEGTPLPPWRRRAWSGSGPWGRPRASAQPFRAFPFCFTSAPWPNLFRSRWVWGFHQGTFKYLPHKAVLRQGGVGRSRNPSVGWRELTRPLKNCSSYIIYTSTGTGPAGGKIGGEYCDKCHHEWHRFNGSSSSRETKSCLLLPYLT